MRAREPYEETLVATLARGWSEQLGTPVSVRAGGGPAGQRWRLQPLLSAYVCPPMTREARRFLADTFRFTPNRRRALPQFVAASVLTTNPGLFLATRPGFCVDPGLAEPGMKIVQPGNQRVRVFDFSDARSRVFVKTGFSAATMQREIAVRGDNGPFLPILSADADGRWLEEPLVDAWALPRCPPWIDRGAVRREALAQLDDWLNATATVHSADEVAAERLSSITRLCERVQDRFGGSVTPTLLQATRSLARRVGDSGREIRQARSHGDLQPGNVLVSRHKTFGHRAVWLIDWEHTGRRGIDYDRFTFGLQTRNRTDLAEAFAAFVDGSLNAPELRHLTTARERRAALDLFVLEDLEFFLTESLSGPYSRPSEGLSRYGHMLSRGVLDP